MKVGKKEKVLMYSQLWKREKKGKGIDVQSPMKEKEKKEERC